MSGSSGSLPRYILQRLLLVIPMMWILMTMVFLLMRVAPGDPISAALGSKVSPQALEQARHKVGLDKPLIVQYWDYLWNTLHLDFGTTFTPRTPEDEQLWREAAARDAARFAPFAAEHGNWGEQDDGRGLRTAIPVSIRLAIDPTLAPEGDE